MQTDNTHEARAADKRAFNIEGLRANIAFRGTVIERMQAGLTKPPARRIPESWTAYEARCISHRITIECQIAREQEARAYEVGALARYEVSL